MTSPATAPHPLQRFSHWLATALEHVFADPEDGARLQPPPVGVQPFTGRINGRRHQRR